ncbi:MAG: DeoR/GlpR family DNA-binding transcription regulator [Chloroflexota bacterium]|nr:DeoR/GlpR family DNA-binding transcription regulator [Chloroflexota bacterium]
MESGVSLSSMERQEQLLLFLEQHERATVDELSQRFDVSVATVRRDLESLQAQGLIQRFHGGAKIARQAPPELPALNRREEHADEKQRIGRAAAGLIEDGDTVFLGSGTTVLDVARHLHGHRGLSVISNSLLVQNELSKTAAITVIGLGGILRHSEMSMIGHITEQALAEVRAQKTIIGIRAIDVEHGLTNDYVPETMTDRAILAQPGQTIIVADHSKCARVSTVWLAPISSVDTLVTDDKAPPEFVDALAAHNIKVLTV